MALEGGLEEGFRAQGKVAEKPLFFHLLIGELPTLRKVAYDQAL